MNGYRHVSGESFGDCRACVDLWRKDLLDTPCRNAEPDEDGDCLDCGHRVEADVPITLPAEACE